jgi:hypothetical protein
LSREPPPRHSVTSSPVSSTCSRRARCRAPDAGAKNWRSRITRRRSGASSDRPMRRRCCRAWGHTSTRRRVVAQRSTRGGRSSLMQFVTHARDQGQTSRHVLRVQHVDEAAQLVDAHRRADLQAERIRDSAQELDVGAVELAGAIADPEHVRRAVVPVAGQRVAPGERLLVVQDQRFVAGVEVDALQRSCRRAGRCRRPS